MMQFDKAKKQNVISDQERFFDLNADSPAEIKKDVFYDYAVKELRYGFFWLGCPNPLLEYGCGTGIALKLYLDAVGGNCGNKIIGVDISQKTIERIRQEFKEDRFIFLRINANKIPQVEDGSVKGCYLTHVLHHSKGHEDIFKEIYKKLSLGGKFFICDLSPNNFIINFCRKIFIKMPKFFKNKFGNDLVVEGAIPEKYDVLVETVQKHLKDAGFVIEETGYGHLFVFVFEWADRFLHFSKLPFFDKILKCLERLESFLLKLDFFKKRAHLFYIKCKKDD